MGHRLTEPQAPVQLRSVYGGEDRGQCLIVAVGIGYAELTAAQVTSLVDQLQAWLVEEQEDSQSLIRTEAAIHAAWREWKRTLKELGRTKGRTRHDHTPTDHHRA